MTATRAWGRTEQRRAELAEAAARRFHRRGFHRVSLADVAADVGLSAPAVYRHFRGKEDLLAGAIAGALDVVEAAAGEARGAAWPELVRILAAAAVTRPDFWTLLQREIRYLGPARREPLRERFRQFVRPVTAALARERPELDVRGVRLRAAAVLAVLASPTGYRGAHSDQERLLAAVAERVSRTPGGPGGSIVMVEASPTAGRGEELLQTAIRLFAERGYDAVSLDDIAAGVGMAGPSIYHYFSTKAELLVVAFTRAAERLAAVRRTTSDLDGLVAGYIELALRERLVLTVYVHEAGNLPGPVRRRVRTEVDADVAAWVAALRQARPQVPEPALPVLVHAARAIVHDLVRLGRPSDADLQPLVHAALATDLRE